MHCGRFSCGPDREPNVGDTRGPAAAIRRAHQEPAAFIYRRKDSRSRTATWPRQSPRSRTFSFGERSQRLSARPPRQRWRTSARSPGSSRDTARSSQRPIRSMSRPRHPWSACAFSVREARRGTGGLQHRHGDDARCPAGARADPRRAERIARGSIPPRHLQARCRGRLPRLHRDDGDGHPQARALRVELPAVPVDPRHRDGGGERLRQRRHGR